MAKLQENESENPPQPAPPDPAKAELDKTDARQAEPARAPRRALRWGLALAVLALAVVFLVFAAGGPNG